MTEQTAHEHEPRPVYTLREAVVEDMDQLRPLQAESWLATYPNEAAGVSLEWVKGRTDSWLLPEKMAFSREIIENVAQDPDMFYRLAETDGKIAGFVHCATNPNGTKELEAIYTLPETFGTGLGKQLMEAAVGWIGDTPALLKVASYNDRAIRFYQKYGFEKVENSESLYAETIPTIQMKREGARHEV